MARPADPDSRPTPGQSAPAPGSTCTSASRRPAPTFRQQVMWRNRGELAAQGVVLPGHHPQDHYRASQDLRDIHKMASDPTGSWTGEWEILARQAQQAPRVAVISHELFSAADAQQAERAVRSLEPAEVHVVLTVRDMALAAARRVAGNRQAPQRARLGGLARRTSSTRVGVRRPASVVVLAGARHAGDPRHLVAVGARRADPRHHDPGARVGQRPALGPVRTLLERRPGSVDLSRARANASLGLPEVEFLRRLNEVLPDEVPDWFYMWNVKETVAHQALAARPPARAARAARRPRDLGQGAGGGLISALNDSGYDLVGASTTSGRRRSPSRSQPGPTPSEQVLDAAVQAASALVVSQYRKASRRPGRSRGQRGLVGRVESTVAASPRLKRTVRELAAGTRPCAAAHPGLADDGAPPGPAPSGRASHRNGDRPASAPGRPASSPSSSPTTGATCCSSR